jgi:hypothetical protein
VVQRNGYPDARDMPRMLSAERSSDERRVMVVELNFSGKKFYVTVKDQFWNAAKAALELTGIMSDTKMKECCVVAKLMEASNPKWPIKCKVPTDEGHDVILELF